MDTPERFVADLSNTSIGATTNPYAVYDPAFDKVGGETIRAANLVDYLHSHMTPEILLVGEAQVTRVVVSLALPSLGTLIGARTTVVATS